MAAVVEQKQTQAFSLCTSDDVTDSAARDASCSRRQQCPRRTCLSIVHSSMTSYFHDIVDGALMLFFNGLCTIPTLVPTLPQAASIFVSATGILSTRLSIRSGIVICFRSFEQSSSMLPAFFIRMTKACLGCSTLDVFP